MDRPINTAGAKGAKGEAAVGVLVESTVRRQHRSNVVLDAPPARCAVAAMGELVDDTMGESVGNEFKGVDTTERTAMPGCPPGAATRTQCASC